MLNQLKQFRLPAVGILFLLALLVLGLGSWYTVDEGHVSIVKRFGEAQYQEGPGLHFKAPVIDQVEIMEVRARKRTERLPAATDEQMPITATVSVNWIAVRASAIDLYREYGSLTQFEERILDPRLKSAAKTALSKFTAENLIRNRDAAVLRIEELLGAEMKDFPVLVSAVQIDNIELPPVYLKSIEAKQTEKNLAEAENHKLARQALQAQQEVNTANAQADALEATSTAEANAIRKKGEAEADAIRAKAKALRDNPLIVELTKAQQWNGALPTMVTSDSGGMILQLKQ